MLSGVKFIPPDQISTDLGSSVNERKKSDNKKDRHRRKKKKEYSSSSDDDEIERVRKSSRKKKKQYSSYSSESETSSDNDKERRRDRERVKNTREDSSSDEELHKLKSRSKARKKRYSSESSLSSAFEGEDGHKRRRRKQGDKKMQSTSRKGEKEDSSDDSGESVSNDDKEVARKEMGLEWMLKPENVTSRMLTRTNDQPEEPQVEELAKRPNPKELNPYLKDNGSGYPEEGENTKAADDQLLASSVVGDGGASWRRKALKRAQEQAAREGRKFEEVVEERWGSLGHLAVSAASHAAPARAHLRAIKERKRGRENPQAASDDQINHNNGRREYLKDVSVRHSEMKEPKVHDSLSWRKKGQNISKEDTHLISAAASSLNKFENDGSFIQEATRCLSKYTDDSSLSNFERNEGTELNLVSCNSGRQAEDNPVVTQTLSANQLAAKAMQLRMKGKHEEADKLLKEVDIIKAKQDRGSNTSSQSIEGRSSRHLKHDAYVQQKKKEEDADLHLAQKIVRNKQYSISGQADDEYDYDDGPIKKRNRKKGEQLTEKSKITQRILTQQERCHFCFENPTRPGHLVVSIANFTYLMLPQWQPIVQGHCYIVPMQHESATRTVDDNVWEEIRNFKKCLIMMFRKQEKDVVFLETVIGLAKQRRHCLVECIPLPKEIARQAPLYFKKAIDEAEEEWSQHNAKKLIDTSEKGLRGSIPKNFPYFHVEFGLNVGFVHVIDDEQQFKSSLGLNVIRGMLQLPEEDMHRRQRHESVERQKLAVSHFAREWEPFDWTKQLD